MNGFFDDQVQRAVEVLRQRAQEEQESEYKERAQRFIAVWTSENTVELERVEAQNRRG